MPPAQEPGTRGRPRVKGKRLLNPEKWAAANADKFERVVVRMYGRDLPVPVASCLGMAYRSLPGRLLRYVVVIDPAGICHADCFISTDLDLPAAEVVAAHARRWPLEQTFKDCKQKLGLQSTQLQMPTSVRRHPPTTMLLYSLVVLWYLLHVRELAEKLRLPRDPWYAGNPRPSFPDMLACLRRASWAEALVDPASPHPISAKNRASSRPDRRTALVSFLAGVVATG